MLSIFKHYKVLLFDEGRDVCGYPYSHIWNKGEGEGDPAIDLIADKEGYAVTKQSDIQVRLPNFRIDVDVDKINVKHLVGSGVEFAAGAEGIGVSSHKVIYNIDSIGWLPQNKSVQSEVVLGYRFIPR